MEAVRVVHLPVREKYGGRFISRDAWRVSTAWKNVYDNRGAASRKVRDVGNLSLQFADA